MCKAPKAPTPKDPKKPQFLRNKYLDEFIGDTAAVNSLRTGRSSLRIPMGSQAQPGGRLPGSSLVDPTTQPAQPAALGDPNVSPLTGDFRIKPRRVTSRR